MKKILLICALTVLVILYLQIRYEKNKTVTPSFPQAERISETSQDRETTQEYQTSLVSWYGREACDPALYGTGCFTASGELFNENTMTVAHRSLPFGT